MTGPAGALPASAAPRQPAGLSRLAGPGGPAPQLPRLREDIALEPGPTLRGGAPSWTLHDPVRNRFFRISWLEFEILCRWRLREPQAIVASVNRETTLTVQPEDVERLLGFLDRAELLLRPNAEGAAQLLARSRGARKSWLSWLTHSYLFIRIPLLRPEAALRAILPVLGFVYSRGFMLVSLLAGLTGLVLSLHQWDSFLAAVPWFFSLEGALVAALALFASKALHELGHGLTAVRHGCRVPSMGVALLVLAPVLYTDTSAAWRLRNRRDRLAIGAAGIVGELYLAMYALLLWHLLPDGLLRSVVYVWATTTWILTVFVNASPFLRFDGYYLFSDALDVPNLQERSFALARHRIRQALFGFDEPPPEYWSPRMRRILTVYAVTTWIYRFFLFLGIALLVYHLFFKALGVILFAVEIWYFIMRPVVNELREWASRLRSRRPTRRSLVTLAALALLVAALFVPWRGSLHLPAVMVAREQTQLYAPVAAKVLAVHVAIGDAVEPGQPLVSLASPDLAFKRAQAKRNLDSLSAQAQAFALTGDDRSRAAVLVERIAGARSELAALEREQERLVLRAPFRGIVAELAEPLGRDEWLKGGEAVALVADLSVARIDAYVEEADLRRIGRGAAAVFVPADIASPRLPASVAAIDETAVRVLGDPELASNHGGHIAVRQEQNGQLVPDTPVYRVRLEAGPGVHTARTMVGTAIVEAERAAIATALFNRALSIFYKEFGFS